MDLKVINSNSQGNCYILGSNNATLLIECGVKFSEIKQALNFDLYKVDGCIITHEHQDHCKAARDLNSHGIEVVASPGTFEAFNFRMTRQYHIAHAENRPIKDWNIKAFKVDHDAKEPLGYIIEHPECGKVLFVTDTNKLRYKFVTPFDHIIIEANYCEDLADQWRETKGNDFVEGRRLNNHMSFQTAMLTLSELDLSKCRNIVLIHLSDGLTNAKRFTEDCQARFGIPTTIAEPQKTINFSTEY